MSNMYTYVDIQFHVCMYVFLYVKAKIYDIYICVCNISPRF